MLFIYEFRHIIIHAHIILAIRSLQFYRSQMLPNQIYYFVRQRGHSMLMDHLHGKEKTLYLIPTFHMALHEQIYLASSVLYFGLPQFKRDVVNIFCILQACGCTCSLSKTKTISKTQRHFKDSIHSPYLDYNKNVHAVHWYARSFQSMTTFTKQPGDYSKTHL